MRAPANCTAACADGYSGCGGVGRNGDQTTSGSVPSFPSSSARRMAMLGLLLMAATGFLLFAAEATHVASNPVFQIKAVLIALQYKYRRHDFD